MRRRGGTACREWRRPTGNDSNGIARGMPFPLLLTRPLQSIDGPCPKRRLQNIPDRIHLQFSVFLTSLAPEIAMADHSDTQNKRQLDDPDSGTAAGDARSPPLKETS